MAETELNLENFKKIFELYPKIKLVYFFGSKAVGNSGPLSDYDLAFYVEEKNKNKISDLRFELMDKISNELGANKVDIIMLNTTEAPELKYNIIKEGRLIYSKEPYKVLVEPQILNEYFDFHSFLLRYNLTKAI